MKGGINQMNQKELLEKEFADYNFYRGSIITFLVLAFLFSMISIFFVSFILLSFVFSELTFIFLCCMFFMLYKSGKLNLKWTANYKLKEEVKGGKKR